MLIIGINDEVVSWKEHHEITDILWMNNFPSNNYHYNLQYIRKVKKNLKVMTTSPTGDCQSSSMIHPVSLV